MFDEEGRKIDLNQIGKDLSPLSQQELNDYIRELEGEIQRVQEELKRKGDVLGAAESVFK